ncbi:carbon-nitrogen hydrolase family protein [Rhodopirellula halodulae]|uniref:carbon-nitrogen hydrolase family protein n=1 Tax=Rhodopirellula halodulae TaxID=2894198 RepID=UPI001E2DF05D|nr:carbon-nitrogen hydrolase family protein [Rhodopirellula sp. JC737]MCC9655440.1 carbon-nitrogen hydrolase family protein [Rhodopirellula sp. JC737]
MNHCVRLFAVLLLGLPCYTAAHADSKRTPVRVAMAQIVCIDSDRDGNLRRIENAVQEAASREADLVCFPETALYGWVNPSAHELADTIPGRDSDALAAIAKRHQVMLSVGLAEKDGESLYDSAVLIDSDGTILLKHRKINVLTHLMQPPYQAGTDVETVETRFGRMGVLICADTFDDSVVERMQTQRPDLLVVPYGWAARAEDWPKHGESLKATISRATKRIGCTIVGTNLVGAISGGPWQGMIYGGQSYCVSADGEVLCQGTDRDREISVFDVAVGNAVGDVVDQN